MRSIDNWYSSSTSNSCRFIIMNKHILFQRRDGRENLITFCCPMLYLCCPRDGYRDVISAGLSRFGDPRRRSATAVAVPRQLSRYGEAPSCAMQAIAAHLSPFRDRRDRQGCATPPLSQLPGPGPLSSNA